MVSSFLTSPKDQERIFSGRGQADADGVKVLIRGELLEQVEQRFHVTLSLNASNLIATYAALAGLGGLSGSFAAPRKRQGHAGAGRKFRFYNWGEDTAI